jgi:prevent-host-death family protein
MATTKKTSDAALDSVKRLGTREARNQFSHLIGHVHYTSEPVIIERAGKPMVVMLSVETYERLLAGQLSQSADAQEGERDQQQVTEPLLGAFPELAVITNEDLAWAKQLWNQSVEEQDRITAGLEPSESEP